MDNHFTLKTMATLQQFIIEVVGTEIFCPWWPGKNAKKIGDRQINFNEIFWSVDLFGTLINRWMDNIIFLLAMIFHTVMDASKCLKRRPIVNQNNNGHVDKLWGKKVRFIYGFHKIWMTTTIGCAE